MKRFGKHDLVVLKNMPDEDFDGNHAVITHVSRSIDTEVQNFGIYIEDHGNYEWVTENNMDLIDRNREDKLKEWEAEWAYEEEADEDEEVREAVEEIVDPSEDK